jgi:CRISPR-associated protein Cas2
MMSGVPLSPYRIMWMLVMFDLPVMTDEQRKRASGFRNELLDRGYVMAQFSIYMRHFPSPEASEAAGAIVKKLVPPEGKVNVLAITDKQYERMETFYGGRPATKRKKPEQFELF